MSADIETLDARGLKCPLPVLKLEKRLEALASGAGIIVLADDPVARIDIPLLCKKQGYACTITQNEDHIEFAIKLG